jgi:hypothetical protein
MGGAVRCVLRTRGGLGPNGRSFPTLTTKRNLNGRYKYYKLLNTTVAAGALQPMDNNELWGSHWPA